MTFLLILFFFVLLLIGFFIAFYFHAVHHSGYWHRRGIPGPESKPFVGNLDKISGKKLGILQLREWSQQFGPVYGIQQGWTNILVCSDVEMLNEMFLQKFQYFHGRKNSPLLGNVDTNPGIGMFSARGPRWKRLRSITTPVFSVNSLKKVLPILDDSSRKMMDFMDQAFDRGQPFNIHPYFHELTMDVISRIAMGQKESTQFRTENTEMARRIMSRIGNNPIDYLTWIFPRLWMAIGAFAKGTWRLRREPFRDFHNRVVAEVGRRKREKIEQQKTKEGEELEGEEKMLSKRREPVDFIDLFLEAESDEPIAAQNGSSEGAFQRAEAKVSRRLTLQEIVSQCILFLLAGFDTTANTLSFTCWYLAWHPRVQEELQREIDAVCGDLSHYEADQEITFEQLKQLKYSDAVMREVLRLEPIAANAINRVCAETTTLGQWTLEPGTVVQPDLLTLHLDKKLWGPDAHEFRPERWFEDPGTRPSIAWLPFGAGPRICLGMRLAQMEQKLALVHLLSKYSIRKCAQTEVELKRIGQGVFNPESVTIKLELRQQK